ncbi:hypothetical protein IFM89_020182 [Coptis chinensis]|uniref:RRM domain-containing protein n=1 Tax=Coptis chinensis TaxID=261450 RepID=A0A835HKQ9_9MAGN|nr:hypothetical protein IFM89_020182 [Coptis chinensis]
MNPGYTDLKRTEEEEDISLCFWARKRKHYSWYKFNPKNESSSPPCLICDIPLEKLKPQFGCTGLGSKVYVVGGIEYNSPYNSFSCIVPSSYVFSIDTCRPGKLEDEIRMIGGKISPTLAVLDEKIYVLGSTHDEDPVPWAEVFDPTTNTWDFLSSPSPDVLKDNSIPTKRKHVVDEKNNKIYAYFGLDPGGVCSFDVTTNTWEYGLHKDITHNNFACRNGRHVILDDVLFMFSKKHLYAYKLVQGAFPSTLVQDHSTSDDDSSDSEADDEDYGTNNQNKQKLIKVTGLEEAVESILAADDTPAFCVYKHRVPVFLLHLGNQDLCMLWHSFGVQGSGGINVNCAVFHIQEKPDGSFHAHVHRIDHHPLRDVLHMNDCFTLKQSRQHSSASPDSVLKVEQAMSRIHVMSQASRHARRLYVGGLPSETSKEAIVELFNCKVKGSFHSGVVHDVHVNQEESYAIVEFFSVEEASQAMKLGTIYLEVGRYHVPDLPSKPHYPQLSPSCSRTSAVQLKALALPRLWSKGSASPRNLVLTSLKWVPLLESFQLLFHCPDPDPDPDPGPVQGYYA